MTFQEYFQQVKDRFMGADVSNVADPTRIQINITGEAAGSAFPFGLKLVELLRGAETADKVRHEIHYHF